MSDHLTQRVAAALGLSTTREEFKAIMLSISLQRLRGPHPDDGLLDAFEGSGTTGGGEFEVGVFPLKRRPFCTLFYQLHHHLMPFM